LTVLSLHPYHINCQCGLWCEVYSPYESNLA